MENPYCSCKLTRCAAALLQAFWDGELEGDMQSRLPRLLSELYFPGEEARWPGHAAFFLLQVRLS